MKQIVAGLILIISFTACVNVRPYQKVYLNDEQMQLSDSPCETFEINFEGYREGAAGGNIGKAGGGCGCN